MPAYLHGDQHTNTQDTEWVDPSLGCLQIKLPTIEIQHIPTTGWLDGWLVGKCRHRQWGSFRRALTSASSSLPSYIPCDWLTDWLSKSTNVMWNDIHRIYCCGCQVDICSCKWVSTRRYFSSLMQQIALKKLLLNLWSSDKVVETTPIPSCDSS